MWLNKSVAFGLSLFLVILSLLGFLIFVSSFCRNGNNYGFSKVVNVQIFQVKSGLSDTWYLEVLSTDSKKTIIPIPEQKVKYARIHLDESCTVFFNPKRTGDFCFPKELEKRIYQERLVGIGIIIFVVIAFIIGSTIKIRDDGEYVSCVGFDS
jgi:hypothetical protein